MSSGPQVSSEQMAGHKTSPTPSCLICLRSPFSSLRHILGHCNPFTNLGLSRCLRLTINRVASSKIVSEMCPESTAAIRLVLAVHLVAFVAADEGKSPLALAYGLSTAFGVLGILFLVLCILWLRRRHKKKTANQEEGELERWCACKECTGCLKRKGGGNGSITCATCKDTCGGDQTDDFKWVDCNGRVERHFG
ncbi:hypothetical protein GQ44DRAFT_194399 [Phaeosphaeriaceae sp. PMI808]|nr:hypothetical protein GQ44DRAFT_194399 [Phaeosphaeriaceae sp. PMI808]